MLGCGKRVCRHIWVAHHDCFLICMQGRMKWVAWAACLVLASTASAQLPVTVPASLAQPYVQGAANVITNATQAGANTVGAVANTINTLTTGPGQVGTPIL